MQIRGLPTAGFILGLALLLEPSRAAAAEPGTESAPAEEILSTPEPPTPPPVVVPPSKTPRPNPTRARPRPVIIRPVVAKPRPSPAIRPEGEAAPSPTEREDELRRAAADHLTALGYPHFWEAFTLDELLDKEDRIRAAGRLHLRGVEMNWTTNSLNALLEVEKRIIRADRLLVMGKAVDWRKYNSEQLAQMEVELCQRQAHR
jgi:hypothetical protein